MKKDNLLEESIKRLNETNDKYWNMVDRYNLLAEKHAKLTDEYITCKENNKKVGF